MHIHEKGHKGKGDGNSRDSHWSNRRNGPRENKRTPEEQEKELYDKSPYPTHPIF